LIKLFISSSLTLVANKLECFQPCIIFESRASRGCLLCVNLLALQLTFRTNKLERFKPRLIFDSKSRRGSLPGVYHLGLTLTSRTNKLECLSLTSFFIKA
jgi:hypothetical protein